MKFLYLKRALKVIDTVQVGDFIGLPENTSINDSRIRLFQLNLETVEVSPYYPDGQSGLTFQQKFNRKNGDPHGLLKVVKRHNKP